MDPFPWQTLEGGQAAPREVETLVIMQVNLTMIAALLKPLFPEPPQGSR
jgi:hypothetical protein